MIVSFSLEFLKNILWWTVFEFLVVRIISIQCFYFLVTVSAHFSLSAVIVNKKIRGAALGAAVGAFFAFIFQTQHSYLHYSKREVKYVNVILFRIACYTKKIQNCPPKDIFLKFERKAHNHSTLAIAMWTVSYIGTILLVLPIAYLHFWIQYIRLIPMNVTLKKFWHFIRNPMYYSLFIWMQQYTMGWP